MILHNTCRRPPSRRFVSLTFLQEDTMEPTMTHLYTTIFEIAQHGPQDGKPFFGFVIGIKTTQAEYAAKLHYKVAQAVLVEQGCAPEPMVFCPLDDVPDFLGKGFMAIRNKAELPTFDAAPHHYEQARQK